MRAGVGSLLPLEEEDKEVMGGGTSVVGGWAGSVGGVTGGLLEVGDLSPDAVAAESSVVLEDDTVAVVRDDSVPVVSDDMAASEG